MRYDNRTNTCDKCGDKLITGKLFWNIIKKARKDLNIRDDNFHSPIDHSRDPELGIIQSKGAIYNPVYHSLDKDDLPALR